MNVVILFSLIALVQCTKNSKKVTKDVSRELVQSLNENEVILEYNGGVVTAKEVNEILGPQLELARQQILLAYSKAAEEVFYNKMSEQENSANKLTVSDEELQAYMKSNNIAKSETEKIRVFLSSEKIRVGKQIAMMELKQKMNLKNRLMAIESQMSVSEKMPSLGKSNAPVSIQVFCDFGNPACNRSRMALVQLKNELSDKLLWVYRHFPVASSPIGMKAALVSICANKQGKFWKVHDSFYDKQSQLTPENLAKEAVASGLEGSSLETCLQSESTQKELDEEIRAAQMLGINSTPVYFVNGVRVSDVDQLMIEARQADRSKK